MESFVRINLFKSKLQIISILIFIIVLPIQALSETSINVNIDSWVYPALERLASVGLIESGLMNTRPLTRMEVARMTGEAMGLMAYRKPNYDVDGLTLHLLERLKKEFRDELSNLGITDDVKVSTFIKPIDEMRVKYNWLDGNYTTYNNDGIRYGDHNNASLEISGYSKFFDTISLYYQPIFKYNQNLNYKEKTEFELKKGYAKLNLFNIEFEIGRDSLWWGPGYHGDLLMTNNAEPFDMVKIGNPRPILLPWIFRYLGPFKVTFVLSKLDENISVPEQYQKPYLYGLRLNIKPLPNLEMGLSQIAIFGGKGVSVSFLDAMNIVTSIYADQNLKGKKENNQQAAIDFSYWIHDIDRRIRLLKSIKLYAEFGEEDTGHPPKSQAYIVGLVFNDLLLTGKTDLRVEFANTSPPSNPTAWYTHSHYPPYYKGRIFGHYVGTDADDFFVRATSYLTNDLTVGIDLDVERMGLSRATKEEHYQSGVDLSYNITDMIEIKGRYGFERVDNYQFVYGVDKHYHYFGSELAVRF